MRDSCKISHFLFFTIY